MTRPITGIKQTRVRWQSCSQSPLSSVEETRGWGKKPKICCIPLLLHCCRIQYTASAQYLNWLKMAALEVELNDNARKNYVDSNGIKVFHNTLNDGLCLLGYDVVLKEEQYEALLAVTVRRKDCLVVLLTGFGKWLVHQLLPFVLDYLISFNLVGEVENKSCAIVVSPLNALMRDQVSKQHDKISLAILKNKYDTSVSHGTKNYDLGEIVDIKSMPRIVFAHPESLVNDKKALKLLKSKKWEASVSAIVVDEAHLVIDW